MSDKVKATIATPKGELMYVQITGSGKLDYDGKFYEYVASVKLDKKNTKMLYDEICGFFNEHKPTWFSGDEPSNKVLRKHEDGDFLFQFKTKTEFTNDKGDTKPLKVGIINPKLKAVILPEDEAIGNGSLGRISGVMTIHSDKRAGTAGVSLWLRNVQLLKYIKYVADTGFDEEDDAEFDGFDNVEEVEGANDFRKKSKKDKKKKKSKD